MDDQPSGPGPVPGADADVGSDRRAISGMSRWQKVVGVIGLVVLAGIIVGMLGGDHGPSGADHRPDNPRTGNQSDEIHTDRGGEHDPSQWDH